MRGDGLVAELLAHLRVLQRGIIAGHGRADRSPGDAIACLIQTHQRPLQSVAAGQQVAFEFRNDSWFADDVYDALKAAGAALCLSEREDNAPPPLVETAPWGYVRLRLETYSDDDLEQWARRLEATSWREIYAYFMHEPTAPAYARTLMGFASS